MRRYVEIKDGIVATMPQPAPGEPWYPEGLEYAWVPDGIEPVPGWRHDNGVFVPPNIGEEEP
jgi:hypothetical protein